MKYLVIISILFNTLMAQETSEPLKYYTDYQKNDKVNTYSKENFKARFYAFSDETACFTCIQTLINTAQYINRIMDSEVILFLKSDNFAASSMYIKKEGWNFTIIDDKIGAYQALYKCKKNPICYLTGNYGEIRFIGVPGSSELFDVEDFKAECLKLSKEDISNQNPKLELVNEIKIELDSNLFTELSQIRPGKYNDNDGRFYLNSFRSKKLIIIDSNGKVYKVRSFKNFFKPFFSFEGRFQQKLLFVDFDQKSNLHFHTYDSKTDSVDFIYSVFTSDNSNLFYPYLQYDDSTIISTHYISNMIIDRNGKNLDLFSIHHINKNETIKAGKFAQVYYDFHLKNYFHIGLALDNDNNILVAQNFSDTLCFYNIKGSLVKTSKISYDSNYYFYNWRESFGKLDNYSNIEDIKVLYDSVSNLDDINSVLYDKIMGNPVIIYHKKELFPSGQRDFVYYLNIVNPEYKYDYKFPYYNKPFYINDNKVYCIQHLEKSLTINVFKLK